MGSRIFCNLSVFLAVVIKYWTNYFKEQFINSNFNVWWLDDGTLESDGSDVDTLISDLFTANKFFFMNSL